MKIIMARRKRSAKRVHRHERSKNPVRKDFVVLVVLLFLLAAFILIRDYSGMSVGGEFKETTTYVNGGSLKDYWGIDCENPATAKDVWEEYFLFNLGDPCNVDLCGKVVRSERLNSQHMIEFYCPTSSMADDWLNRCLSHSRSYC